MICVRNIRNSIFLVVYMYKRNKYKANHPASMNSVDFRPSSQENIVSGKL